ncbi:ribonuclease E [Mesorhizobium albiziae]|uniref:Ribonuclease E n=1 Tax=Neomesorhizobium albiziae TaxID=335020 RepID=A0A1I4EXN7_9HYPH|nr:ribonuclease E/G [Mesorhizobium albiziae]GLS30698.1 ribonuclease E [Mesorhizobium albiziae]SFL10478.1 ribonuclease E [Mesorhizobium albiziae]
MPNKMLIDASHPEETRVVVVRGNRIEEFDFESQDKKQLKGNIYLARVTRVEPSLQAAFVEYGGNRHGFLAFSEIHPDYYQIPVADRQALLRAEAEEAEAEDDEDNDGDERQDRNRNSNRRRRRGGKNRGRDERRASDGGDETTGDDGDPVSGDTAEASGEAASTEFDNEAPRETAVAGDESAEGDRDDGDGDDDGESSGPTVIAAAVDADVISEPVPDSNADTESSKSETRGVIEEVHGSHGDDNEVESVGAEDALEEVRNRRKPARRNYKIQEVIKRRQILLVQVVKEERGNKGAALTTYLSLAGRYSVLMPNTARGGGISRKITNAQDRKRLKEVVQDLGVPQGMGVILRTAGESRTKAEIKRDYEYLMRLWENVRNLTLQSTAPALVYEEGSLIKRSVRDLYNKDIDEVLVAGDEGYREAKDFMRMLMPSHAKVVQPYRDSSPIFARNGIEAQLDRMLQPQVTLKSGGYIIINQTEALVSIDVNSGRSTKEHSIEDTALQTNLEAAEEVARQLRLRDLAGLIVIDFIDMEENRNNRAVEKRLKDHLKNDRARIQVGRISHFGLLEMSRQRIRASVLESTMKPCPHCGGTGHVRSDSSVALLVVRAIEEFLLKDSRSHITVRTPAATALYVLNHKRSKLVELETRFAVSITLETDETVGAQHYAIFRGALAEKPAGWTEAAPAPAISYVEPEEPEEVEIVDEEEEVVVEAVERPARPEQRSEEGDRHHDRKRKRRRRRRGGRDRERDHEHGQHVAAPNEAAHVATAVAALDEGGETSSAIEAGGAEMIATETPETGDEAGEHKKRRRGKRGGKRNRKDDEETAEAAAAAVAATDTTVEAVETVEPVVIEAEPAAEEAPAAKPKKPRRTAKSKKAEAEAAAAAEAAASETVSAEAPAEPIAIAPETAPIAAEPAAEEEKPRQRVSRRKAEPSETPPEPIVSSTAANDEEPKPKKAGWWQRKSFF